MIVPQVPRMREAMFWSPAQTVLARAWDLALLAQTVLARRKCISLLLKQSSQVAVRPAAESRDETDGFLPHSGIYRINTIFLETASLPAMSR